MCRGDASAADLCSRVFEWSNHYDHLVDGDTKDYEGDLHAAMWLLVTALPSNTFYRTHLAELSVTMTNAVSTWRASVALERAGDRHALHLAYVMRWIPTEFFLHVARLCGGAEWEAEIAPEVWRAMTQDWSFEEFVSAKVGD